MKKISIYISVIVGLLIVTSCELDNYDAPNAKFYGTIIDSETNEPIEQDIINGAQIEYIEHGYENPETQYMIIQNDGTFRNDLMFEGAYTMRFLRGNFVTPEPDSVVINITGETNHDFILQPYIRIKDINIQKSGDKVVAMFKLEQTESSKVKKIGLYAHPEPSVGEPMRFVASEQNINAVTNESTVYTLEIDLAANSSVLIPGQKYFFRIGALIDVKQASLNYATAVRITV